MRCGTLGRLVSSLLVAAAWVACSPPAEPPPPVAGAPVVLLSIDTLRSDRVGAYGYGDASTPRLDELARSSTLFERAYTVCPLTLPAHSTVMTGALPPDHGVRDNRGFALDDRLPTLAERFRDAGYRTGGFVSSMVLRSATGIGRGFDRWDDAMDAGAGTKLAQRRGDVTLERALAWIDEGEDDPRPPFLFLHLYDPHSPYEAPAPWSERLSDPYDAEVAWTDELVGRLRGALAERGLDETAWLVVFSDHGEGLGDHVELEHGLLLYRETLQVPLLVRPPGGARAARREDPVSLVDLMPTVLERAGLADAGETSRSWFGPGERAGGVYAETLFPRFQYGFSPLRAAIRGSLHYIEAPRPELYDLVDDPGETENLLNTRSAPPSLLDLLARVGSGRESRAEISAEERERLAALGYVGGAVVDGDGPLPDPKDRVAEVEELFRLADRVGKGRDRSAERRLVTVLRELGVHNESLARTVANNLLEAGAVGPASEVLAPFRADPEPETRQLLGQLATESGDLAEAERQFRAILAANPDAAGARLGLGIVALSGGRDDEARAELERALVLDDRLAEAWNGIAVLHAKREEWRRAINAWKRSVEVDPTLADAWYNLALVYEKTGDRENARAARRRYESLTAAP